jgi:hypothetical protein
MNTVCTALFRKLINLLTITQIFGYERKKRKGEESRGKERTGEERTGEKRTGDDRRGEERKRKKIKEMKRTTDTVFVVL